MAIPLFISVPPTELLLPGFIITFGRDLADLLGTGLLGLKRSPTGTVGRGLLVAGGEGTAETKGFAPLEEFTAEGGGSALTVDFGNLGLEGGA